MSRLQLVCVCLLCLLAATGCEREQRRFTTPAGNTTPEEATPRQGNLQPALPLQGGVKQAAEDRSPYDGNAYAVNQGKRLYRWFNCNGCHANGGGGMGPPLADAQWRYGSEPAQIFASITQGRPQGMPSFGGHIPDDQVWQIVAYVRSMSGQLRKDVAPSRADSLYPGPPENARPRETLRAETPRPDVPAGGAR